MKYVCPVCGYVYEGDSIPEDFKCPTCGVPGSKFKPMETGKLAAEHEFGVYASTVKNNPDISDEDKQFIAQAYGYMFIGLMLDWIKDNMREDPRQIVDRLSRLIKGSLSAALSRFKL